MIEFNATFIVAMFSFVVFIFIMNAIFYNPILSIIRKREGFIDKNYEEAKRFEQLATQNTDVYSSKIGQTQDKCRHEIKIQVGKAQTEATEKLRTAKENFKAAIQQKKDDIHTESEALKMTVRNSVVKDLATSIVSKILGDNSNTGVIYTEAKSEVKE